MDKHGHGKDFENTSVIGSVYILTFSGKLSGRASTYLGWARNVTARVEHHRKGTGAAITAAAVRAGFTLEVALTIHGVTRYFERWLKNRKNTSELLNKSPAELLRAYEAAGGDQAMQARYNA